MIEQDLEIDLEKVKGYGQLFLKNFALKGVGKQPIINPAELKKLTDAMNWEEKDLFNIYIKIANYTELERQRVKGIYSNSLFLFSDIYHELTELAILQENEIQLQRLPIIVTKSQYEELKKECQERTFKPQEDGTPNYMTLPQLINFALNYYNDLLHEAPRKRNPLKTVKKQYQAEPIPQYMITYAVNNPNDLLVNGNLPNKWEFLYLSLNNAFNGISAYCKALTKGDKLTAEEQQELKLFYHDFKELIDLLLEDIEAKTKEEVTEIDIENWNNYIFGYKHLYELDLYNYRSRIDTHINIFSYDELLQQRALRYGVAILEEDEIFSSSKWQDAIDGNNHYIQPNPLKKFDKQSLNFLLTETKEAKAKRDNHYQNKQLLIQALRIVIRYNTYIDILIELTEVEELGLLKFDIEYNKDQLKKYNDGTTRLLANIYRCNNHYEIYTEDITHRLSSIILTSYCEFNIKRLLTPSNFIKDKEIEKLKALINDGTALKDISYINNFIQDTKLATLRQAMLDAMEILEQKQKDNQETEGVIV